MPAKQKPAAQPPKSDADSDGTGASFAHDNRARQSVQGQRREGTSSKKRPEPSRTRGVDDYLDEIAADNEKAFRKASVRARRLGLH